MNPSRTLVVGIGSPHGDDRLGWRVAEALSADAAHGARVHVAAAPNELLDWLDGVQHLILCDACRGTDEAGTIHCWTWPTGDLQRVRWSGTHDLGLCAVLELAEQLGRLPPRVSIWSVNAQHVTAGEPISAEVEEAVAVVVDRIQHQLRES